MAAPAGDEVAALAATHKLKLYKFTAYMGLQDPFYPRMFRPAEAAAQQVTEAHL